MTSTIVESGSVKSAIAKQYNLEFDKKYGYYIGNAYKDSKGNYLPSYMYYNDGVYALRYYDGCFNPYLVKCNSRKFGILVEGCTVTHVMAVSTDKVRLHYEKMYGSKFEML